MTALLGCPWLLAAFAFVCGATAGRFLNRSIDRFPRHEYLPQQLRSLREVSVWERTLRSARRPAHRLPIVGWLLPGNPLARGRGETLGFAGVELVNGLLLAALAWVSFPNGLVPHPPDPFAVPGMEYLAPDGGSLPLQLLRFVGHAVLFQALLVASVIDLRYMIIPDGTTVPATLFALLLSVSGGLHLMPVWFEDEGIAALLGADADPLGGIRVTTLVDAPHLHGPIAAIVGLIVGGGVVWAVRLIGHWALGREAMGFGDVILMGMIGTFVGWQPVLVIFFLAPLCALVVVVASALTGKHREFPYGPWLSAATVLLLLAWPIVWPAAGRFFLMGRVLPPFGLGVLVLLAILLRLMRLLRGDAAYAELPYPDETAAAPPLRSRSGPPPGSWDARRHHWPGHAAASGTAAAHRWRSGR